MEVKARRGQKDFKCPSCQAEIQLQFSRFASGAKGSSFEAQIARQLAEAIYGDPKALCRTPLSGGLGSRWPFDIYPPKLGEDAFPYGVECKFRADWDLTELLEGKRSKPSPGKRKADTFILDWWENTKTDALKHSKIPVLVFKKNRYEPLVMLPGFELSRRFDVLIYSGDSIFTFKHFLEYLREKHGIK